MKKTLAALAVLGAFAGTAVAADVTLYGDVDTGFKYTHEKVEASGNINVPGHGVFGASADDSTNTFEMANGINSASKFGLKGTEDLGNGMTVGFKLENGFNSDDGTFKDSNRLFNREARLFVSGAFGEVSLGRMGAIGSAAGTYDIVYAIGDSFDGGDEFAFGLNASDRYDNMITYQTPQFAGLQLTAQYSLKENSKGQGDEGRSTADRYAGLALTGEYGPAQFVVAYELQKYSTYERSSNFEPKDGQTFYLGGNFDFGVAKVFAMGQYFKGAQTFAGDDDLDIDFLTEKGIQGYGLHLGSIVPVAGGELTVGAYYADAELKDVDPADVDGKYYGVAARYCYPLSERTTIYAGAGYAETKVESSASLSGISASAEAKKKVGGAYVGLSHHF